MRCHRVAVRTAGGDQQDVPLGGGRQPPVRTELVGGFANWTDHVDRMAQRLFETGEIADVVLGAQTYEQDVRFNGETATFMGIWVLPTANSLEVIKKVRAALPEIRSQLPPGMKVGVPYDSSEYIQSAINEVLKTLTETLIIVAIVIYLFLGSLRSVLVPLVAIPISLIGGIFLMQVFGFTINLLTLLAIVLSVGLVVAIEPMINAGSADVLVKDDGWTAVTKDGSLSAHFEHSVAVTDNGPIVLSRS